MNVEKDYYDILSVSPEATDKEIRQAYRQLARQFHPDTNPGKAAEDHFAAIQEAYEVLADQRERKKYDHWRRQQKLDKSSVLSVHTVTSHQTLPHLDAEQAYYVLLSLMSTADFPKSRLPLNICLVVDRSTSMRGTRLQQVKEAIGRFIDKLQPEDSLALVTFSDRAQVLLPSQSRIEPARAKAVVSTIQPSGGTEIFQGLEAGIKEIERSRSELSVNYLLLLTDGQTYGDEQACIDQARWAGLHQIQISTIGIGTDWNEELLLKMADLAAGSSVYIDSIEKVKNIFSNTIQNLEKVVIRELKMMINLDKNVRLQEAHQITPHITPLDISGENILLGPLSTKQEKSVLLEFRLQNLYPGEHRLMRIRVDGDVPGKMRSWEQVEPTVQIVGQTPANADIPSLLMSSLSKLAVYKMELKVKEDLAAGRIKQATQRLQHMATRLLDLGEAELSHAALLEAGQLARTGSLTAEGTKKLRFGTRALNAPPGTIAFSTRFIG